MFYCLALLSIGLSMVVSGSACPEVKAVENFDACSTYKGAWYQIARTKNLFEVQEKCVYYDYSCENSIGKIKIHNTPFTNYSIEATATYAHNDDHNGDQLFTFTYDSPQKSVEYLIKAVAIDYDRYGIWYSCQKDLNSGSDFEQAWIFSRTPTLDEKTKEEIDNFLKSADYIKKDQFLYIDHTPESCK